MHDEPEGIWEWSCATCHIPGINLERLSTPRMSVLKSLCSIVVIIEALFYCSSTLDAWKLTRL